MLILCIGDVVGSIGCETVRKQLPSLKKTNGINLVICNGENSADGNGITPSSARYLFDSGVDVITLGNHAFRRKEFFDMLDEHPYIIRPGNFPDSTTPGSGICEVDLGKNIVSVINIMGNSFMDVNLDCAFETAERLVKKAQGNIKIVDFHAEATGEKRAMGFFLDGKVSAVFGTHTHVQTADQQILPMGTGYITDVGMTGTIQSVLGVKPELIIKKLKTKLPVRFDLASGDCKFEAVMFEIDEKTGKCTDCNRVSLT